MSRDIGGVTTTLLAVTHDADLEAMMRTANPSRYELFGLFTEDEAAQLDQFVDLVTEYLGRKNPDRPLCLAVFGAPGSGKSRLVKDLPSLLKKRAAEQEEAARNKQAVHQDDAARPRSEHVDKEKQDTATRPQPVVKLATLAKINLTQIASIDVLAAALDSARTAAGDDVPFVFFDEFDSAYDGAPWGWLSWFLAPMQDGEFRSAGDPIQLKQAVYVFAGGTVSRFTQLGAADPESFALAKGPDFISRLRGFLDIPGVNADENRVRRRQAALDYELGQYSDRWKEKKLTPQLRDALLHVGRYKHGARSICALVELLPVSDGEIGIAGIRDNPLLEMHVDRGPLDPKTIGGCIGVSSSDRLAHEHPAVWSKTCEVLFRDGASLACGGRKAGQGLMRQVRNVLEGFPALLEPAGQIWLVSASMSDSPDSGSSDPRIEPLPTDPVLPDELPRKDSAEKVQRFAAALSAFRMRYRLALRCVAQFAIGGRVTVPEAPGTWKRFPGVVEEIMLALALKHPVYVSRALQGGAAWAGTLLGLGRGWTPLPDGFDQEWLKIPAKREILFRPSPLVDLPLTRADLIDFLRRHALGGAGWVDNGLSPRDNRKLFEATDAGDIARLVLKGLRTRFDRVGRTAH